MTKDKTHTEKLEVILVTQPYVEGANSCSLGGLVWGYDEGSFEMKEICDSALNNLRKEAIKKGYDIVYDLKFQLGSAGSSNMHCLCTGTGYKKR